MLVACRESVIFGVLRWVQFARQTFGVVKMVNFDNGMSLKVFGNSAREEAER